MKPPSIISRDKTRERELIHQIKFRRYMKTINKKEKILWPLYIRSFASICFNSSTTLLPKAWTASTKIKVKLWVNNHYLISSQFILFLHRQGHPHAPSTACSIWKATFYFKNRLTFNFNYLNNVLHFISTPQ